METRDVQETRSPLETHALGRRLAGLLRRGDCLALVGELGAGKTVLVRGLAEGLGADGRMVSSPTYVLVQEYPAAEGLSLFHLDVYRLTEPEAELADLGLEEMRQNGVVVIEWADRVDRALPRPYLRVDIDIVGESTRRFTLRSVR